MDCYIVRVYRRMTGNNGQDSEIAGLVERVGDAQDGKAFSSYQSLVDTLREDPLPKHAEQACDAEAPVGAAVRLVSNTAGS